MPTINNPTPIAAGTFNAYWVTNVVLAVPGTVNPKGRLMAAMSPFDGQHLLLSGRRNVGLDVAQKRATDPTFNTVIGNMIAECKRQAQKTEDVTNVVVSAPDPTKPVTAMIAFSDRTTHRIDDCFLLAGTDATFGGVFMAAMAEIGRQAGLSVS